MTGMLSIGAAVLDAQTLATLKAEIEKPGMSADSLRKRLVPAVSGATFHRALRGLKVSIPVQTACSEMARSLRWEP